MTTYKALLIPGTATSKTGFPRGVFPAGFPKAFFPRGFLKAFFSQGRFLDVCPRGLRSRCLETAGKEKGGNRDANKREPPDVGVGANQPIKSINPMSNPGQISKVSGIHRHGLT